MKGKRFEREALNAPFRQRPNERKACEEYLFDIANMLSTVNVFFGKAAAAPVVDVDRYEEAAEAVREQLSTLAEDRGEANA